MTPQAFAVCMRALGTVGVTVDDIVIASRVFLQNGNIRGGSIRGESSSSSTSSSSSSNSRNDYDIDDINYDIDINILQDGAEEFSEMLQIFIPKLTPQGKK